MIRTRKRRRNPISYDIADIPILSTKRPINNAKTDFTRPNVKLRSLMDQEKYHEARTLFIEIIKSNKFHFQHLWKTGMEIIGKSSPKDLTGYLKAVQISSPISHSVETFNVYIDHLIAEQTWELALEEIQVRFDRPLYHHPILLRKMAICSYQLWKSARDTLPVEYLEDGERDEHDLRIIRYEKHLRNAAKYLSEAHKTYLRDAELLTLYCDYLSLMNEEDTMKDVITLSLKENEVYPECNLLATLIKLNEGRNYFESNDYILQLFELDPFMDAKLGLKKFCKNATSQIKHATKKKATTEEIGLADQLATNIYKLYINRFESLNPEVWFQKRIMKILKYRLSDDTFQAYQYYQLDTLLRSPAISEKMEMDMNEQADTMQKMMLQYQNSIEIKEEEEEEDVGGEEEEVEGEEEEEKVKGEEEEEVKGEEEEDVDEEEEKLEREEEVEEEEVYISDVEDPKVIFSDEPGLERESFFDE